MNENTWHSNPIQITPHVSVDVSANDQGITLGEAAGTVLACDLLMSAANARQLAAALLNGADFAEKSGAGHHS